MKCYKMLQNAKVTAFTVSELLRENKQGIKYTHTLTHTQFRINKVTRLGKDSGRIIVSFSSV